MLDSVTITTEDFATSNYSSGFNCALAKALKRKYPNGNIRVLGDGFFINNISISFNDIISNNILIRCGRANKEPLV